jgi:hypothetical protein
MKKITFLLFTFITTLIVGQDKLTSSIGEYFDGTNWVNGYKTEYTYDSNKNLIEETELYLNSSQWVKSYSTMYSYNSNNKATSEISINYDVNGNNATEDYRTINSYNSSGNLIQILNEESENSNWVNESKFDLTYTDNKLSLALGYEWNGTEWVVGMDDSFRITISYNSNGKVSESKSDSWDGTNWVDADRTVYTYDGNNRLTNEDSQTWNGTNWVTDYKSEYTYDANGNAVTSKESYVEEDGGVLIEQPLETYTFDTTQLMSNFSHPFRDKTGLDEIIFPLNAIVNKILTRSSANNRNTYYYGNEATASVNEFDSINFSVYPNPTSSILKIDDSNFSLKNIEIYNIIGKKVFTSSKNEINLEGLVNGVYVLKVQSENGNIATKRIVKK